MKSCIRNANKEDAVDLALIYSKSFQSAFKGNIPDEILNEKFSYERLVKGLNEELTKGSTTNSIMLLDDIPVGMLTYAPSKSTASNDNEAEIWRIYLLPEYWDQHIGIELMEWALKELKTKGFNKAALWVIEENTRARRFYEKLGFIHNGEIRGINIGIKIKDYKYIKHL